MRKGHLIREGLKGCLLAAALAGFVGAVGRIGALHGREESRIVRDAVFKAALTCYAVEGAYPETLSYLKEHYHLRYNEAQYLVTYEPFAANMLPDIYVVERGSRGN